MVDSDLTTPDKATKFSPGRLLPQAEPNTSRSAVPRAPPTSRKRAKSDIVEVLEEIDRNKRSHPYTSEISSRFGLNSPSLEEFLHVCGGVLEAACATGAGEPVEEDRIGWETVLEEFQPNVAADKGFLHEGHQPYASADYFHHPVGPASSPRIPPENRTSHRTVPGRGTRVQEQHLIWQGPSASFFCSPPSWLLSFTKGRGEEGPRGLSEDTDGVIDQRRKKDLEDLPPARSSRDSFWISSPRPGEREVIV
ncbi:hypothetical protein GEV33_013692 [Tenebrio molitor]|uniref:Uncharacterized protein n=1 Tax=Tenebrio molitor TaxID=7067 RepID=A0A8J6H6D5_TENMO|nr:hypothetical protein GEV33_013692 [Tenebrio molitor]